MARLQGTVSKTCLSFWEAFTPDSTSPFPHSLMIRMMMVMKLQWWWWWHCGDDGDVYAWRPGGGSTSYQVSLTGHCLAVSPSRHPQTPSSLDHQWWFIIFRSLITLLFMITPVPLSIIQNHTNMAKLSWMKCIRIGCNHLRWKFHWNRVEVFSENNLLFTPGPDNADECLRTCVKLRWLILTQIDSDWLILTQIGTYWLTDSYWPAPNLLFCKKSTSFETPLKL